MKETPILMCGEMVLATLNDLKTQTRRIIKNPEYFGCLTGDCPHDSSHQCAVAIDEYAREESPYGTTGDHLWVKETFCPQTNMFGGEFDDRTPFYRATDGDKLPVAHKWKPSIFMPRKHSRITLDITGVKVERLQDISEEDAEAEGIQFLRGIPDADETLSAKQLFRILWNSINLKPNPIYETDEAGKKKIFSYISYPWSADDFDAKHPGVREAGLYRGKPIEIFPNPWVWVISFRRLDT